MGVSYVYIHPESFDTGEISLFELDHEDTQFFPASVKDLRIELAKQIRLLELGIVHEVTPWERHKKIVLGEGTFIWNEGAKDYTINE